MAEDSSSFKRTVVLRDWWLIKCSKEFEGKRFGVAGTQIAERGAVRVFTSSPIITAFDVFTLQASDGVCIILRGFLNKQRLLQSGFLPQISREFIFGFPPCWEAKCNSCFVGVSSGAATTNSVIDKAASILSPCKWNLEDSPAVVVDKNTEEEIDDKDGGSTARDEKPARKKSLRLQAKSIEASIVKTSQGLSKGAKSCVAEKDECEAFGFQGNERKLDESKVKKPTNGGDLGVIQGLDKDKSSDVQIWNLEDSPAVVVDKNTEVEINDKDGGHGGSGGSAARDEIPARKRSLRLQAKSVEASQVKTNHGSEGLSKGAKSGFGGNEGKLDESIAKKPTNVSEGLDKDKSNDVKKDECEVINSKVISPADGCGEKHTGADNVDKRVTSMSATGESLTLEQGKGELEATKACPHSLFEDFEKSDKPGKKAVSNKSGRTLRSAGNAVEHVEHSGTKVKTAKNKRKHDVSEVQDPTTNDSVEHVNNSGTKVKKKLDVSEVQNLTTNDVGHGSEGLNKAKGSGVEKDECMDNEERPRVDGCGKMHSGTNSKKITSKNARKEPLTSEQRKSKLKIRKGELDVKDYLSVGKTIRKIDFDEEVTPEKDEKKQKTNSMSADSLGQKRSRSGRVLVSSLEYWRNQVPVYDADRNLIQVNEGHQTSSAPSKGKGSVSRKPRR